MKHLHIITLLMAALLASSPASAQPQMQTGWISTDVRHTAGTPIVGAAPTASLSAWRGERVAAQIAVTATTQIDSLTIQAEPLRCGKSTIGAEHIKAAFTEYVMTDGLHPDGRGGCGYRNSADYDSSMVADIIDTEMRPIQIETNGTRTCWLDIDVPQDAQPGLYKGFVIVTCSGDRQLARLPISIKVVNRTLPPPSQWAFHLDLWQNPYAVARYYGVEPFTPEHFDRLYPIMKHYADAGGKVITASITHKPWNGQTYDPFESMVTWVRRSDGTWLYDYTLFDRWVEFMMSLGVNKQISCYSMVPWRLSFQYFDMATNRLRYINCKPGEQAYADFWGTMLRDFARHLKTKGWFDITHIAMDERSLPDMLATLKVIKDADPDFKVSLAGTYHHELADVLDDYCITLAEEFPDSVLQARKARGQVSTFYTCCQEREPNTFTFSSPSEAEWLPLHAAATGLDGYLRWALNSWVRDPLHDSRFTAWPAGDTYLLYPDGKTSIRMARLRQGIQQWEKINILRRQLPPAKLKKLEAELKKLTIYSHDKSEKSLRAISLILND